MPDQANKDQREYDLVVYGASGFTGSLVVEYLAGKYPIGKPFRWAVAGRNRAKLQAVVDAMDPGAGQPDILVVDSADIDALTRMTASTSVVITTVGPYARYGDNLVSACIESGTDYCDLCGEVQWMQRMIEAHEHIARDSGARIVHTCGFDCIPSDVGV